MRVGKGHFCNLQSHAVRVGLCIAYSVRSLRVLYVRARFSVELCMKRRETSSEVGEHNHLNKEDMPQNLDGLVYLNGTCHNIWTD
jgi:hypothetical protein